MRAHTRWICALALAVASVAPARAADVAADCRADLDALPAYLLENDAGAPEHVRRQGQPVFDQALAKARESASAVADDDQCRVLLRDYLRTYRRGHLSIVAARGAANDTQAQPSAAPDKSPAFRVLSKSTALIRTDSFADRYGPAMKRLVKQHAKEIAARPNLIIDVRRNEGGSDSTYEPLLGLIAANPTVEVQAEFLATPANIAATERACKFWSPEDTTVCDQFMKPVLAAMQAAATGNYVLPVGQQARETVTPDKVLTSPRRVALMIDKTCGSSCEEFVIAARQSFKVKLFGRSTFGSLDYSNLRPWTLPSGKRTLLYATSRSLRLPGDPVDVAGIAPDLSLPVPGDEAAYEAEVGGVQRVLEAAR